MNRAHNEMDLREHLARWMLSFSIQLPDRYREYVGRLAGQYTEKQNR